MKELRERQAGNSLVLQHLAHLMLVQALRVHLEAGAGAGVGWFSALADKQLGAAIRAIHADPAHGWTLQELGERAGMSRSTFALRFRESLGEAPMQYVARWRMLLACDRLQNTGDPVGMIALALGYRSESAFSTAFKRVMGCSPAIMSATPGQAPRRAEPARETAAARFRPRRYGRPGSGAQPAGEKALSRRAPPSPFPAGTGSAAGVCRR